MSDDTRTELKVEHWHIAPVKVPQTVRQDILAYCRENGLSLSELVLIACMARVGYNDASIVAARAMCYPGRRTNVPPLSMKSQDTDTEQE